MESFSKKDILISLIFLLFLGFFTFQDDFSGIAWGKYKNADFALALNGNNAKLAYEIGDYYFNGRACVETAGKGCYDLEKAEAGYKKAISINPKFERAHYQLARIYFVKGERERAMKEINLELEYYPDYKRSYYVRGLINGYDGRLEAAEKDFLEFISWAPYEWGGYNDLAWILLKSSKYEQAKEIALAGLKYPSTRDNPWLLNALGASELNLRDYDSAKSTFEKVSEILMDFPESEFEKAYPGNNPLSVGAGLTAFKTAVLENLKKSEEGTRRD
ncbi:tetratricopeptide repeat protein [Candidatus Giovannonibacteria bacterium]|nr:tetratricopeptide repeat protein [Candidatus Giovannonibacteria bacterium]